MTLRDKCYASLHKHIRYTGTDANEFSVATYRHSVQGYGYLISVSDSHGLSLQIRHVDGTQIWVEPTEIEVTEHRSIDDENRS